jgi:hypothetical protein
VAYEVRCREAYAEKVGILILAELFVVDGFTGEREGEEIARWREEKVFVGFGLVGEGGTTFAGKMTFMGAVVGASEASRKRPGSFE